MASPLTDDRWPEWLARLLGETQPSQGGLAKLPPARFHCLLDEQPTHLVPQRLLADAMARAASDQQLVVNPQCSFSRDGVLPLSVSAHARLLDGFSWEGTIAWIRDPATAALQPFWLGPELAVLFTALKPGDTAPPSLAPQLRSALACAGVLVPPDYASRRRQEWAKTVARCAQLFQENGYVPVAGLIHPFHIAALRRYYRHLIRTGAWHLGDGQSPRRYVAHNENVARFFHHQLTSAVSALAGEAVKPSYVYPASYQSGAELEKHTDREQCEFSITLCLDYSPEPDRETPWPLHLETKMGTVTVFQAIGDGLLYRGTQLPHYRHPLPEGNTSTSIFFHYVRESFAGKLE
jgi:hypothetical protein